MRRKQEILADQIWSAIHQLGCGIAHDIGNLLFVISGRLEMILGQKQLPGDLREDLNIINAQVERIKGLIENILKFSRKKPLKLEATDINSIIDKALSLVSDTKILSAAIQIDKELDETLPPIKADPAQLQEALVNLLLYTLQTMPKGGGLKIKTSNFRDLNVEISISDTSGGIQEKDLRQIFLPFSLSQKPGLSLALAICYNIISNHAASINVERTNKGKTFIIRIPFT